ncbi:fertility inhibition FinO-like protein [Nostoc sp. CHAB 5836]|uniref:fertility inhibition FinO-like protein n=1 Tax=Nostoc sp. CHAB 5836 TaxID=2780404 RepID=UPI001E39AB00|nr:fertility inhibition FinO-like protein [Nostoc sp. CHAB 5836]MCC5617486.1 fertility inhibition FinO-like protein [Nostoc sp. CHAB 5836]
MIKGKLEIIIKINELPDASTDKNGWYHFIVDCDGKQVSITVKPKVWKKLADAQANYPVWVAALAGGMGEENEKGFGLSNPNVQVFERKPKEV